jgi:hypothetical protein
MNMLNRYVCEAMEARGILEDGIDSGEFGWQQHGGHGKGCDEKSAQGSYKKAAARKAIKDCDLHVPAGPLPTGPKSVKEIRDVISHVGGGRGTDGICSNSTNKPSYPQHTRNL